MSKEKRLIIFDWDGTLSDSIGVIVSHLAISAKTLGWPILDDEQYKSIIGLELVEACQTLYPNQSSQDIQKFATLYRDAHFAMPMNEHRLFDDVLSMLLDLKEQGYLLAIATGKTRVGLSAQLEHYKLAPFFDKTICSDETEGKPHPKMLQDVLSALGVDKEQAVMVGDSVIDAALAKNACVDFVGVTFGASSHDDLLNRGVTICAHDIRQLNQLLKAS